MLMLPDEEKRMKERDRGRVGEREGRHGPPYV